MADNFDGGIHFYDKNEQNNTNFSMPILITSLRCSAAGSSTDQITTKENNSGKNEGDVVR